jgi:hypothetical protein
VTIDIPNKERSNHEYMNYEKALEAYLGYDQETQDEAMEISE